MIIIKAEIRKEKGKNASRRLRTLNKLPAIIYGGEFDPILIELDHNKVWNIQCNIKFYKEVLIILLEGKERKVKVQDIQRHAFKPKLTHIDFINI